MKRQNLEQSIKERVLLLRKDQKAFLQNEYPELTVDLSTRPLDIPGEIGKKVQKAAQRKD